MEGHENFRELKFFDNIYELEITRRCSFGWFQYFHIWALFKWVTLFTDPDQGATKLRWRFYKNWKRLQSWFERSGSEKGHVNGIFKFHPYRIKMKSSCLPLADNVAQSRSLIKSRLSKSIIEFSSIFRSRQPNYGLSTNEARNRLINIALPFIV
jgi:hypothetical protein